MTDYIEVVTTINSQHCGIQIAEALVKDRLAACVQVADPILSYYRWKGEVENAREWQCIIKTRSTLYPQVEARIRELHPYEVPEILVYSIEGGSEDYLKWIEEQTSK